MENLNQTILSQYANSSIMMQVINNWNNNIDPTINIDEFYRYIWNIETAIGFGLDIWGQIIGISRLLYVVSEKEYFGFFNENYDDEGQVYTPFNVAPFFNGFDSTPTIRVDDETYRKMLLAKAYANISRPTIKTFNFILSFLFGEGSVYVVDGFNMTIRYIFNITITPIEYAIIYQSGIMPVPAGVLVTYDEGRIFGFQSEHEPIESENFPWPFNVSVFNNQNN